MRGGFNCSAVISGAGTRLFWFFFAFRRIFRCTYQDEKSRQIEDCENQGKGKGGPCAPQLFAQWRLRDHANDMNAARHTHVMICREYYIKRSFAENPRLLRQRPSYTVVVCDAACNLRTASAVSQGKARYERSSSTYIVCVLFGDGTYMSLKGEHRVSKTM